MKREVSEEKEGREKETGYEDIVWAEKYRPQDFSEIYGQDEIVKRAKAFVEQRNMPHLLFAGPAGTGKTTLALVMVKKLFGKNWRENYLELNASDERGINVIREKVKDFARTKAIGDVPFKIIFLDEADALTKEAQQALRRTMENFTSTCRFILSCNYSSKIIDPIQSRTSIFRFKLLGQREIEKIVEKIAKNEKLKISKEAIKALYEISGGDCRRVINLIQTCASVSKNIDESLVYEIVAEVKPRDMAELIDTALKGNFEQAKAILINMLMRQGIYGIDIIKAMERELVRIDIPIEQKMKIIEKMAEIEFRLVEGADDLIQLESLLAFISFVGKGEK
ncbi:MAG: replication factor C small subunit [Candidatus Pacearchaeota archaeon]